VNARKPSPSGQVSGHLSRFSPEIVALATQCPPNVRRAILRAPSDIDHGDIRAVFKAAIKHHGVTFPHTRKTRMVIKSVSKKGRPGRTARA
jgi:hypothetical protein